MESLAKTLNVAKEIKLGDKTYQLSSFDLNDLAAYEVHLKRDRIKEICSLDIPKKKMYEWVSEVNRETIDPEQCIEKLNSISGMRFLIWRCVLKHEPEITLEEVGEKVDLQNLNEIVEVVSDFPEADEGEQGEKKQPSVGT